MLEACLAVRRGIGIDIDIAATLSTLAQVRLRLGDATRARSGEEEALAIFRKLGDRKGEAIALLHLGEISAYVNEGIDAREFLSQSLVLAREIEHPEVESDCERVLGQLALEDGELSEARACVARSLAVSQASRNTRGMAMVSWSLGKIDLANNDSGSALPHLCKAIRAFVSFGMTMETIGVLEDYARLACSLGLANDSVHLYGAASAARERLSLPRAPHLQLRYRNDLDSLRTLRTASPFEVVWSEGREWNLAQAVSGALALFDPEGQHR